MTEHILVMSSMVGEIVFVDHELIEKQKVKAMIRSILEGRNWGLFKQNLTHNNSNHMTLENDRLTYNKSVHKLYIAKS